MNFTNSSFESQERSRINTSGKSSKNEKLGVFILDEQKNTMKQTKGDLILEDIFTPKEQTKTQNNKANFILQNPTNNQKQQSKYASESRKNNEIQSSKQNKPAIQITNNLHNKTSLDRNIQQKTSLRPQTANKLTQSISVTQSKIEQLKSNYPSKQNQKNKTTYPKYNQQNIYQKFKNEEQIRQKSLNKKSQPQVRQSYDPNLPFIKYYEENIKLKSKQEQMNKQLQILKNQLYEQSKVHQAQNQRQLTILATGKKSVWDTKQPAWKKQKNTSAKNHPADQNKVSNLLQIIDHYKNKLLIAQQQIQNLKRQKLLLQQDGKLKQRKVDQIYKTFQQSSHNTNATASLEQQLKNKTRLLETQIKRNEFNQIDINRLQAKIKSLQSNKQQIFDLRQQNKNLQQKLLRLTSLPSFSVVTDKVDEQRKYKQLQNKYKAINQKYTQLRNDNIKADAQLKLIRNQLIKANVQSQQLQKQNNKLKQCMYQNPIITKLLEDQQLVNQVVFQIQKKKNNTLSMNTELQRQSYDKILMQKQMLANQLAIIRNKMNALQENWKQKQRISKMQKQEMINNFKYQSNQSSKNQGKIMSKNGVAYTDDVSMFTQDTQSVPTDNNYFDLYLGELHLLESMMNTNFSIRNTENSLILATVDFYNHNTQATRPVHGIHCNLQSQFSFKVIQDEFFFKYLNKGSFSIQIWASEGNKRNLIGKATIQLRPLILKSRKNLAPVASTSATIQMNQKIMGSINFVMRLRMPVFEQLQRINQLQQLVNSQQSAPARKLIIQIEQGRDFPLQSNTFVYFSFRLEDYYTKTFKGRSPVWNYYKTIQLKYNTDLKNYLRKNQLQLIVLDDNAVIASEGDSDVVGSAYVSLVPLLQNKPIRDSIPVMRGTQRVGNIHVKIYWHETQIVDVDQKKQMDLKTTEQLINQYMIRTKKTPQQIFESLDNNKTGIISYDQFLIWVPKVSSKITVDMVDAYYKQFKKPVNKINFQAKLTSGMTSHKEDIIKQFSEVNKIFSLNTQVITKKQKLQDYLRNKSTSDICLDMDKSYDGKISREQFLQFCQKHNIQVPTRSFGKQISIAALIRQFQYMIS